MMILTSFVFKNFYSEPKTDIFSTLFFNNLWTVSLIFELPLFFATFWTNQDNSHIFNNLSIQPGHA